MSERGHRAPAAAGGPAGSPDAGERVARASDLSSTTVEELQARAAARGIEGRTTMGKDELLAALGIHGARRTGPEPR